MVVLLNDNEVEKAHQPRLGNWQKNQQAPSNPNPARAVPQGHQAQAVPQNQLVRRSRFGVSTLSQPRASCLFDMSQSSKCAHVFFAAHAVAGVLRRHYKVPHTFHNSYYEPYIASYLIQTLGCARKSMVFK